MTNESVHTNPPKDPISIPTSIESLLDMFSTYKTPLVFLGIGCVLVASSAVIIVMNLSARSSPDEVVFLTDNDATSSAKKMIWVDVSGAVLRSGVYQFVEGSRVADALTAAGGLNVQADRVWVSRFINRAARLQDGGKVYIPSLEEGRSTNATSLANEGSDLKEPLNLNTASQQELEGLPGVGPVTAKKIVEGRPYQTVAELKERKTVGESLFTKISELLVAY